MNLVPASVYASPHVLSTQIAILSIAILIWQDVDSIRASLGTSEGKANFLDALVKADEHYMGSQVGISPESGCYIVRRSLVLIINSTNNVVLDYEDL